MLTDPSFWAHRFPMIRGGGLFIMIMGIAALLGALTGWRRLFVIAGGVAATVAIVLCAAPLSAPFGKPTALQLYFLFGSIALEIILIRLAVWRYKRAGDRSLLLAILFVVGLHFLPMSVAFGPICFILGLVLCAASGIGLWLKPNLSLNLLWTVDGIIKIAFGAFMYFVF